MTFHLGRQSSAKGSRAVRGKSPRVAICFDVAMFERISGEAQRRRMPFAEVVREKVLAAYQADLQPSKTEEVAD